MRRCPDCKLTKALSDFNKDKNRPLGISYVCRRCAVARTKAWYQKNRARPRRLLPAAELKENARWAWIKRKYGLTREQWLWMFSMQGGACACCRSPDPGSKRGWHTDHNHRTQKVRGILCHPCNMMIGAARESLRVLDCGKEYLRAYS